MDVSDVNTVGTIAKRLGEPVSRIEYLIRSRDIEPLAWAGNARIFGKSAVEFLASEIRRIDAEKGGGL